MPGSKQDQRVLILAPVGQDAAAMASLLDTRGQATRICADADDCARQIREGAGALLLTEEALVPDASPLVETLRAQAPWSQLPTIVLTSGGESVLARLLDLLASAAGSITLLERPMSAATLWRSVHVALLSRLRQYQVRDLLEEQTLKRTELEKAEQSLRRAREFDAAVLNSMGEGLYTLDHQGLVTSMNPAAERFLGWSFHELRGRKMRDITHPQDPGGPPPADPSPAARVLDTGQALHEVEDVFLRKDGSSFNVVYTASPLRERGSVVGLVVVFRDVTDRKRLDDALLQSEERFRTLVAQVKDYAIFRTDRAGFAITWNEGVKRVLGFDESEFIGMEVAPAIFTPEDLAAGIPQAELHTAASYGTANDDRWLRRKDGSPFYASGSTTALKGRDGLVIGFSKVLRDDTDKRQAEDNLERTVAERTADLRATNEQLEAFVYSIAHDLRAPLRAMGGFAQLLMDDHAPGLSETGRHLLKRIQASSEFMDRLLVDLLAYGRTARAGLELGSVDLHAAWDNALLQCTVQIEQTKAFVEARQPLPPVRAHEATLTQVLANLLANALKFVAPGVQPRVVFRAEEEAAHIRLWVEDNGIGIPPDQHERVFRVFERLDGSRYPGTGIGLSIVRKGIERMGGSVGLVSTPGNGARFWIQLPKAG